MHGYLGITQCVHHLVYNLENGKAYFHINIIWMELL